MSVRDVPWPGAGAMPGEVGGAFTSRQARRWLKARSTCWRPGVSPPLEHSWSPLLTSHLLAPQASPGHPAARLQADSDPAAQVTEGGADVT